MKLIRHRHVFATGAIALIIACGDPTTPSGELSPRFAKAVTSAITVKTVTPSTAPQNITLDVSISGTGFEPGSNAKWLLNGAEDPRVIPIDRQSDCCVQPGQFAPDVENPNV
jgi:hypothetical protein